MPADIGDMTTTRHLTTTHLRRVAVGVALLSTAAVLGPLGSADASSRVPLGAGTRFAVLAGTGITNAGASTITGDVGSTPSSAETGFAACPATNCVQLAGINHTTVSPNDSTTRAARRALVTAYTNAASRPSTPHGVELGGTTLRPGVYSSGAFGVTGTLVLDGRNDPNAVFVFQTGTTLTTAVDSAVVLTNGARACNVFWKVGTAATLGTTSRFAGTLAAHDNISLKSGASVTGRLFAGAQITGKGSITLIHNTIRATSCP